MALPVTNLSLLAIRTEFGGAASGPISLTSYYRGGANVPSDQGDAGYGLIPVGPAPATISFAPFRNQEKVVNFVFNDVVAASMTNYNLAARATSAGWNGVVPLIATITINNGVYVSSTSTLTPAFITGTISPSSTISLTNNGVIAGRAGNGGAGGSVNGTTITANGVAGTPGGPAVQVTYPISITNNGTIGGGGGGGGGGGSAYLTIVGKSTSTGTVAGGGGGGGRGGSIAGTYSTGGAAGTATGGDSNGPGTAGSAGTNLVQGSGGPGGDTGFGLNGGLGGAGGGLGLPGAPGNQAGGTWTQRSLAGGGGAAGAAIQGGSYITWLAFGSRLGSIDHPGINGTGGSIAPGGNVNVLINAVGTSGSAQGLVSFQSDGDVFSFRSHPTNNFTDQGSWYSPETAGVGNFHWARIRRTAGSGAYYTGDTVSPIGGPDVWLPMTGAISVQHEVPLGGYFVANAEYEVAIAADSAGSSIVATWTATIEIITEV